MEGIRARIKISISVIFVLFVLINKTFATDTDSSRDYLLIADMEIQVQATAALNNMYNFKFQKAYAGFLSLKFMFKNHPLPYFLLGLNEWWQMMPNMEIETHDDRFLAYMDTAIMKAEKLYDVDTTKIEGAFFLAAANAFKARLYTERGKWFKAATTTSRSLNYLEDCRNKEELSPELMFGDGLYNYYSNWIPDHYPQLRPFMILFSRGDKHLGLEQLRKVAHNAFYTRTEAQYWLMYILFTEEDDKSGALYESEYLHQTFPDNAFFQRYYANILYSTGHLMQAKYVCEDMLAKIDSGKVGYEAVSGRYACFILGQIWESNMESEKALYYYRRAVQFGEEVDATDSGYYLYSLMGIARIYDRQGKEDEAIDYLKKIRKSSKNKNPANKRAKEYLKSLKQDDN